MKAALFLALAISLISGGSCARAAEADGDPSPERAENRFTQKVPESSASLIVGVALLLAIYRLRQRR